MRNKHTPGPWMLSTNPIETNDHAASIYGPCLNGGAPFICDVSRSPGNEQALENAKLIAASPELLGALKELLECDYTSGTHLYTAQIRARNAIVKATL